MNRIFYENELNKTLESLKLAMNKLNEYQKTKKVIMPEQQLQSQLALYGSLISEKIELEGKLRNLSNIYNPEAPQIKEIQTRLAYINQKISEIEGEINTKSPISTEKTLEALPDYMQLYLQVQQLKGKYEVLAKLLEQNSLDELKENLYVEVIDNPTYPEKPSKPKKKLMVALALISSLFLAIFIVFIREYIRSRRIDNQSV
jgi:tyrosine-protein kinase Etk/Wzc